MAKYLHLFDTVSAFNAAYTGETYLEPWVSYTEENSAVTYNKTKKYMGGSVLDLSDIENNPNIEKLPQADWPGWVVQTGYENADIADKYLCWKLKDFVLPGLTAETPTIQTVITDWSDWQSSEVVTRECEYLHGGGQSGNCAYDWRWGTLYLNYDGIPGKIWYYVSD